jgi:rubredoxin
MLKKRKLYALRYTIRGKTMTYKRYMCLLCGFIYDEAKGWPDDGILPGTRWDDVPLSWQCPECGATKDDFEMVQIS